MKIINVDNLIVWHKKILNAKGNGPPNYDGLSNPLVVGNQLIVSLLSPGKLLAYDLKTQKVNWQLKYKYLGGFYPQYYEGCIYAGTAQEIYCVSPMSGKVKWTFCPYGRSNEHLYASPVLDGGKVYIGDRWGLVYCLDAKSGDLLWKTQTGTGDNIQVNTSPIIKGNNIYVLNTCGRLEVLAKKNGMLKWFVESDAASIYKPQFSGDSILFHNDEIIESVSLKPKRVISKDRIHVAAIKSIFPARKGVIYVVQQSSEIEKVGKYDNNLYYLIKFKNSEEKSKVRLSNYADSILDFGIPNYLCIVGWSGIEFYSTLQDKVTHRIDLYSKKNVTSTILNPVFNRGKLYVANIQGYLYCMKLPKGLC